MRLPRSQPSSPVLNAPPPPPGSLVFKKSDLLVSGPAEVTPRHGVGNKLCGWLASPRPPPLARSLARRPAGELTLLHEWPLNCCRGVRFSHGQGWSGLPETLCPPSPHLGGFGGRDQPHLPPPWLGSTAGFETRSIAASSGGCYLLTAGGGASDLSPPTHPPTCPGGSDRGGVYQGPPGSQAFSFGVNFFTSRRFGTKFVILTAFFLWGGGACPPTPLTLHQSFYRPLPPDLTVPPCPRRAALCRRVGEPRVPVRHLHVRVPRVAAGPSPCVVWSGAQVFEGGAVYGTRDGEKIRQWDQGSKF